MILDEFVEFADAVTTGVTAATSVIGDVVDTQIGTANTLQNLGVQPIYLVVVAATLIDLAGTSTLQYFLSSDSTADLATSATDHITSEQFSADVAAGTVILAQALPTQATYERFIGIRQIIGTADLTAAGTINAFLTLDVDRWVAYADSPNVV